MYPRDPVWARLLLLNSKLVHVALALALLCQQGCLGGDGEDRADLGDSGCDLPLPEFAARTDKAEVEGVTTERLSVGAAGRDASVTIVGYCQPTAGLPRRAPVLIEEDGRRLHPIGGELQQTPREWRNYYLYAPTRGARVSVRQRGVELGVLEFEDEPENACSLRAGGEFEVVACGAIVLLDWSSQLPFDARKTTLVDINAMDGGDPSRQLNYYDLGYDDGPRGLRLRFGIRRPSTDRVELALNYVYVRRKGGDVEEIRIRRSVSFGVRP